MFIDFKTHKFALSYFGGRKMNKYTVSNQCIGCRACVGVAKDNFGIKNNLAYIKKQPKTKSEEKACEQAMHACPVDAITHINSKQENDVIVASSNIKETLDKYPQLKNVLIELSPKFKKMQNPALYNTLARFANFNDAAKMTGLSICEILHAINDYLNTKDKLLEIMPECIETNSAIEKKSVDITWKESEKMYIYNQDTIEEIVESITHLKPQGSIIVISKEKPDELLKIIDGLGFLFNIEKNREYRISLFNPKQPKQDIPWRERKDEFHMLDVREMEQDPFDVIMKKAYKTDDGDGFILIQRFEPYPIINMLSEMGFEHETQKKSEEEFWIYFYKKPTEESKTKDKNKKTDVVIQSATPVAYPVIMKLLQSKKIRENINIKELKVWDETEKHLAWITNKKADISFSAIITAAKLKNSDIKMPALFVWDNFTLLSRKKAKGFKDLIGETIHLPLFEEAPPAKITKYLIQANGLNPDDFEFVYGKPFGRPEKIYKDFIESNADTVVLREPEASYAIKIMQDRKEEISIISYNELWNMANKGFGAFPNAGLVFKGEFVRKYPKIAKIFMEELKTAIDWVTNNKKEAAKLSFDIMRQPMDRIELFLDRVNFEYVDGEQLKKQAKNYFDILNRNKITDIEIDEKLLDMFDMDI